MPQRALWCVCYLPGLLIWITRSVVALRLIARVATFHLPSCMWTDLPRKKEERRKCCSRFSIFAGSSTTSGLVRYYAITPAAAPRQRLHTCYCAPCRLRHAACLPAAAYHCATALRTHCCTTSPLHTAPGHLCDCFTSAAHPACRITPACLPGCPARAPHLRIPTHATASHTTPAAHADHAHRLAPAAPATTYARTTRLTAPPPPATRRIAATRGHTLCSTRLPPSSFYATCRTAFTSPCDTATPAVAAIGYHTAATRAPHCVPAHGSRTRMLHRTFARILRTAAALRGPATRAARAPRARTTALGAARNTAAAAQLHAPARTLAASAATSAHRLAPHRSRCHAPAHAYTHLYAFYAFRVSTRAHTLHTTQHFTRSRRYYHTPGVLLHVRFSAVMQHTVHRIPDEGRYTFPTGSATGHTRRAAPDAAGG